MKLHLKLGHKIVLYWLISMVIAMALVGYVFVWMDGNQKEAEAYKGISREFSYLQSVISKNREEIRTAARLLSDSKDLISSVNLVSTYQEIENYSAIIFDVEKERILDQISHLAEGADLDVTTVFDVRMNLVAYHYRVGHNPAQQGFVTYKAGTAKIRETKPASEQLREVTTLPTNIINIPSFSGGRDYQEGVQHLPQGLFLERTEALKKTTASGEKQVIGYIKTGRILGPEFAAVISRHGGYKFGMVLPGIAVIGQFDETGLPGPGHVFPLLSDATGEARKTAENPAPPSAVSDRFESRIYFGAGRSMKPAEGSPAVFLFASEKKGLRAAATTYRNAAVVVLVAITLLITPFSIAFVGHFISAPITRIVAGFEDLKKGQFVLIETPHGHDEMTQLMSSFNVMSETLQDRDRDLRLLSMGIEQSHSIVVIANQAGDIEYVNPKFEEVTGYKQASVIGKNSRFLKSGHTTKLEYERLWETISSGKTWRNELYNRKQNGDYYWEDSSISPIKGEDGKIEGFIKVAEDITRRKEAERRIRELNETLESRVEERTRELSESQALTDQLLTSAGEGIFGLDSEGRTTFVNPAACAILGYAADELIGRTMHNAIHHSHEDGSPYPHNECPIHAAYVEGKDDTVSDEVLWRKNQTPVPVRYTCTPIYNENILNGAVVTFSDVTELKEHEKELERSNAELQHFAYVAAHDLQEPLRKIQAFSERLETRFFDELGERGQQYIERIVNSSTRMRSLIDDLLNFSRVRTKAQPFEATDLNNPLADALDDLETSIAQAEAEVTAETLPTVDVDKTQIRQVFQNIVGNAIKFRDENRPLKVRITSEVIKGTTTGFLNKKICRILVRDTGIGFDPKFSEKIFGVFERLHGRSEYSGTGIGLATCRVIVERHGGTLKADSQPGEGSTFEIMLPVNQS